MTLKEIAGLLESRQRIMGVSSGKGGVGKTALSTNIAAALASDGADVLIVDADPQGTQTLLWDLPRSSSFADVLGGADPAGFIVEIPQSQWLTSKSTEGSLSVLRGDDTTTPATINLYVTEQPETILLDILSPLLETYDLIIIDTPPSVHSLAPYTYTATGLFIVPVGCTLEGIGGFFQQLRNVQDSGHDCEVIGIVPCIVPHGTTLADGMITDLFEEFGGIVWPPLYDFEAWRQAPVLHIALGVYKPRSKAYREFRFIYRHVVRELKMRGAK